MKIVSHETFFETLSDLAGKDALALDTETTGLKPYKGDILFSVAIASRDEEYYFNFNPCEDDDGLGDELQAKLMEFIANWQGKLWFLHNAKFDMHILAKEGCLLQKPIHDTMIVERLLNNTRKSGFDLATLLQPLGLSKDDAVMTWINSNPKECKRVVRSEYRGAKETLLSFQEVPFDLMAKYACMDVRGTYALGVDQYRRLQALEGEIHPSLPRPINAYKIEQQLLPVVFEMERVGVKIDKDFCIAAAKHEEEEARKASEEFEKVAGQKYVSSAKALLPVFEGVEQIEYTEKGNAKFSADVLAKYESEPAKLILKAREHTSKANFYKSFLDAADEAGVIHANFNQTGTTTGRFSSSEPNLQNLTKETGDDLRQEFVVRRAFVPREGYFFAMLDYDQVEYRLLLDAAEETTLVDKILGGLDVHEATAQLAGVTRQDAKKINFGLVYGEGIKKLAKDLGVTESRAAELKEKILGAAPKMQKLMQKLIYAAKNGNRRILNWAGFLLNYQPIVLKDGRRIDPSYKAPNGFVQGGCAYVMKIAMIKIHEYLKDKKSRMVATVHDELFLEVAVDEVYILERVKQIMETTYPHKRLPLTVGLEHSFKSFADKVDGCPSL